MRIALCLSGQPRTWRSTRESLMAFFAGHELDLFLHTWREGDPAELEALVAAYAPRASRIEARPLFVEEKRLMAERFPTRPPLSIFDMFHSIAASLALAAGGGEYDLVVRARFDALFDGLWSGEVPAKGELIVPDDYPHPQSCSDQFAIGGPAEMRAYGGMGDWLGRVIGEMTGGDWLRPEPVLQHYLEAVCGLRVAKRPTAMKLCREDQAGRPFAAVIDSPLFHAAKHADWESFALEHFPEVVPRLDFDHPSRTPLALDRALGGWAEARGPAAAHSLFAAPWPSRIMAIDAFLTEQAGGGVDLDEDAYKGLRLICAALLRRMDRAEPLEPASAVVHMLSDNIRDMRRVNEWLTATPGVLDRAMAAAPAAGLLARALAYKPPLTAFGHDIWGQA